jgi:hypothetical protein
MELLKIGKITPLEFFDVVNTGNLDVAVQADKRMLDFIAVAKEQLLAGKELPPIPGINHQLYIKEIHSLLFDVDILSNPKNQNIMRNITQTLQQQLDIMRNGDEIANLIYGGKPPTPMAIEDSEATPGNPQTEGLTQAQVPSGQPPSPNGGIPTMQAAMMPPI